MVVLELYFKTQKELKQLIHRVIFPLCENVSLSRVLLTFKGKESTLDNPRFARLLVPILKKKNIKVSVVWSAKCAYVGAGKNARAPYATREDATYHRFKDYIDKICSAGVNSTLVVSGGGKKKTLDSMATLRRAAADQLSTISFGVVFNPHIGGSLDSLGSEAREEEWNRLQEKLKTGLVKEIWIAFGADVKALEFGLSRLRNKLNEIPNGDSIQLFGSFFVPSKSWIAKMRFRCWTGTFLGGNEGDYLSGVPAATSITKRTLELMHTFNVEPVIESSVRTEKEAIAAERMLNVC